uniref:Uncharacterized protein n=1 Tax=Timema poppense TaxID=170557 RepID=A0A7R9GYU2_TIMPO|nr:unnamed protein product [Timema poppensis]
MSKQTMVDGRRKPKKYIIPDPMLLAVQIQNGVKRKITSSSTRSVKKFKNTPIAYPMHPPKVNFPKTESKLYSLSQPPNRVDTAPRTTRNILRGWKPPIKIQTKFTNEVETNNQDHILKQTQDPPDKTISAENTNIHTGNLGNDYSKENLHSSQESSKINKTTCDLSNLPGKVLLTSTKENMQVEKYIDKCSKLEEQNNIDLKIVSTNFHTGNVIDLKENKSDKIDETEIKNNASNTVVVDCSLEGEKKSTLTTKNFEIPVIDQNTKTTLINKPDSMGIHNFQNHEATLSSNVEISNKSDSNKETTIKKEDNDIAEILQLSQQNNTFEKKVNENSLTNKNELINDISKQISNPDLVKDCHCDVENSDLVEKINKSLSQDITNKPNRKDVKQNEGVCDKGLMKESHSEGENSDIVENSQNDDDKPVLSLFMKKCTQTKENSDSSTVRVEGEITEPTAAVIMGPSLDKDYIQPSKTNFSVKSDSQLEPTMTETDKTIQVLNKEEEEKIFSGKQSCTEKNNLCELLNVCPIKIIDDHVNESKVISNYSDKNSYKDLNISDKNICSSKLDSIIELENELPIIQNSAIQDCNTKVETINFNNEYNMDNPNLKSDPISEDNKKMYSSSDVDNSLTSVEQITPITTRLPNMDDDLEFSSSQLLLLENEFRKANLAKPNPGDTMTTKDRRTPSFVLPPSLQPPSIDWARKAQQNRQRLQNIIQDISKLNALLTRARKMSFLERDGTHSAILSQRSAVEAGYVLSACSKSSCSFAVHGVVEKPCCSAGLSNLCEVVASILKPMMKSD